jgi:hypothetical protein
MRSQVRSPRPRWSVLLSVMLYVLAVIALNAVLVPTNFANPPEERRSIRVFFSPTETSIEFLRADGSQERQQPGQRSDELRPLLAQESEPDFLLEGEGISASIPVQVSELPKPPDPRPPIDSPEISPPPVGRKGRTPIGRRSDSAFSATARARPQSPPSSQRAPKGKQVARLPGPSGPILQSVTVQIICTTSGRSKNLYNQASTRIRSSGVSLC